MSTFDTHGGYFAPKDYMKVEAGGSHEENPNGGVQIGVDQEGTPNLLEEGEPVYKDYVYSDNIKASERFLKENNIPEKYAGELYSKIADSFFTEAENRPYDPISRNGLEAMLGRLADAQEGQKAYNEQRQLERELKNLSPDELAALEEMLAAQEQPGLEGEAAAVPPMPAQPETVPQEPEMIPQEVAPGQMPMMRNGGKLFKDGGDRVLSAQSVITEPAVITADDPKRLAMEEAVRGGINRFAEEYALPAAGYLVDPGFGAAMAAAEAAKKMRDEYRDSAEHLLEAGALSGLFSSDPEYIVKQSTREAKKVAKSNEALERYNELQKAKNEAFDDAIQVAKDARKRIETSKEAFTTSKTALENAAASGANEQTIKNFSEAYIEKAKGIGQARREATSATLDAIGKGIAKNASKVRKVAAVAKAPGFVPKLVGGLGTAALVGASIIDGINARKNKSTGKISSEESLNDEGADIDLSTLKVVNEEARGGKINRFPNGGQVWDYKNSRIMRTPPVLNPSIVTAEAPRIYDSISPVTVTDTMKAMPSFSAGAVQLNPPGLLRRYSPISFEELARRTFGNYTAPDMESYYGPTHEWQYKEEHPVWGEEIAPAVVTADRPVKASTGMGSIYSRMAPTIEQIVSNVDLSEIGKSTAGASAVDAASGAVTASSGDAAESMKANPYLSTFPRYAGAIGSGLLGLYNAFQKPDRYTATRYKPFAPTGRISLQDQVYNPVDQNMLMNQVLAQGNSTQRALRNSGLGPSTAAAMIAQDNSITGNLGNTFLQTWDANNQRRNQVIAANNANEAQRAQFDYAIDAARQRALADAQMRNAYNDLQLQQLNYAAEGDKYAAISNQISNALQALSGIGQENFVMNQVNSNPANEGYGAFNSGVIMYDPYRYARAMKFKCGGKKK